MIKRYLKRSLLCLAFMFTILVPTRLNAEVIEIEPLFEYPVAPEEIISLSDKSNWLMQHFWDNMDFKKKDAVNQSALNDAFRVFTLPMQWADKTEVDKAVDSMLSQLSKNPTLLLQFTKAAEESLYGQRAKIWIDEVYIKYLEAFLKNKKISDSRKIRYRRQLEQLKSSMIGQIAPSFNFTTPTGNPGKFQPIGVFTIIEFGDPDCDDCRFAKLKMETDVEFSELVDKGKVNVLFIIPNKNEGWQDKLSGFSTKWHTGANEEIDDLMDLRTTPALYVIDEEGKIAAKNISVATAMAIVKAKVREKEKN